MDSTKELSQFKEKYLPIIDKDLAIKERSDEIDTLKKHSLLELNEKYQNALNIHARLEEEIGLYKESIEIGEFGLYEPIYNFNTSEIYKLQLEQNYQKQKYFIKSDQAVKCHTEWQVGGSLAEGKKMTEKYKKLMLFAGRIRQKIKA